MPEKDVSIVQHLTELRKRLIISLAAWFLTASCLFGFFGEEIFRLITLPLTRMDLKLIMISPLEGFTVRVETCLFAGFLISLPVILWQAWMFIMPALYTKEKRIILIAFFSSFCLFLGGITFAYYSVLEIALKFLLLTAGVGFVPMLGASKYLGFLVALIIPFGVVFQLPVLAWVLTRIGVINHIQLKKLRRVAVVVIMILSAVLTPTTDIFSLSLMAVPMLVLYEVSILVSYLSRKKQAETSDIETD